jgi:hypothetical protein
MHTYIHIHVPAAVFLPAAAKAIRIIRPAALAVAQHGNDGVLSRRRRRRCRHHRRARSRLSCRASPIGRSA